MAVYISPNRITCIPGFADTTSCKIGIYTFFDPTSDLVYLTINNTTYVSGTDFTLTQRGTDGTPDQACWSGSYTVSNLVGHSEYTWRVSQTVSSVQYKDSGSFRTAPGADDDFSFFFVSCDNNTGPASVTTKDPTGAWGSIREYAQSGTLPVAGIFYVDDYGYVDRAIFNDGDGTGLVNSLSPTFLLTEFSYTAGWMLMFGMLGNNDDDSIELLFGREENRAWCRKNLNLWMQWGDHELNNDIGWDDTTTFTDDPNVTPIHSTYIATVGQYDGPGIVSFENMIGLTRPDLSRNLDTIAQHWVAQVGCITLVAPDFISRCEGYTLTFRAGP